MKRRIVSVGIIMMLMLTVLTACGDSVKDEAIKEIDAVKVAEYFEDEQDTIKGLKEEYTGKVEKAKDDAAAEKVLKSFKKELKEFKTKDQKIDEYVKAITADIEKIKDKADREKAEKVLADYQDQLDKCKTNAAFEDLTAKISAAIKDKTDVEVAVPDVVKQNASANNAATKRTTNSVSNSTKKNNNNSYSNSNKGTSSGGSSKPSKPAATKPVHQHSWKAHYATGYKTESYLADGYYCKNCHATFGSEAEVVNHSYETLHGWQYGIPSTHKVPYQYVDYQYCSCGATTK